MKIELKQKDNLTLLPTFLEVELSELPDGLSELEVMYFEFSKYDEIVINPTIHDTYIYNYFLPFLISRLMTENIPVSIIIPCPVVPHIANLSVRSIIVCDSAANIIKSTRFFKTLTTNDFILINELDNKKQINLIKKQLADNKIPVTLAVVDGLLGVEDLKQFQVYASKLNRKEE